MRSLSLVLGLLCWGCTLSECPFLDTRCSGDKAQICDGADLWRTYADCGHAGVYTGVAVVCSDTGTDAVCRPSHPVPQWVGTAPEGWEPAQGAEFWTHMSNTFNVKVFPRKDAPRLFDYFSPPTSNLTYGHEVFVDFVPGIANPYWSRWQQYQTCAHEMTHVEEWSDWWAWRYIFSRQFRLFAEQRATVASMSLELWRYGDAGSPRGLAQELRGYGATERDVAVAEKVYGLALTALMEGIRFNRAARAAVDWLGAG